MSNVQIKGSDMSPLTGESFGRIGMGPCKKNFVMPKELATILMANLILNKLTLMKKQKKTKHLIYKYTFIRRERKNM